MQLKHDLDSSKLQTFSVKRSQYLSVNGLYYSIKSPIFRIILKNYPTTFFLQKIHIKYVDWGRTRRNWGQRKYDQHILYFFDKNIFLDLMMYSCNFTLSGRVRRMTMFNAMNGCSRSHCVQKAQFPKVNIFPH